MEICCLLHSAANKSNEYSHVTSISVLSWFLAKGCPFHRLAKQYRMHPDIFEWQGHVIYDGQVENA